MKVEEWEIIDGKDSVFKIAFDILTGYNEMFLLSKGEPLEAKFEGVG